MCSNIYIYRILYNINFRNAQQKTESLNERPAWDDLGNLRGQWRLALEFLSEAKKPYGVMAASPVIF